VNACIHSQLYISQAQHVNADQKVGTTNSGQELQGSEVQDRVMVLHTRQLGHRVHQDNKETVQLTRLSNKNTAYTHTHIHESVHKAVHQPARGT